MEGNIELNYNFGNYAVNFDGELSSYFTYAFNLLIEIPASVVNMIMWSSIEACASVICASLPYFSPLLKKGGSLGPFFTSLRSMFSLPRKDLSRSLSSKRSMRRETSSSEETILGPGIFDSGTREDIKGGRRGTDMEMGQIRLETTVHVENASGVSEAPSLQNFRVEPLGLTSWAAPCSRIGEEVGSR